MGNAGNKEELYSAINSDNTAEAEKILKANSTWINEPMTEDCQSTPIGRAAWRGNVDMIYTLLNLGADVNLVIKDRLSPLQVAARRGKEEAVDYLIQKGADITYVSYENMNALDYAILYTNYNICKKLMNLGCEPKETDFYHKLKDAKLPFNYDYEKMIDYLKRGVPLAECPSFILNPPEKTYRDPVIDPRETWGDFFKRVANFEDPPLVERSELPPELQPQNRVIGRVIQYIHEKTGGLEGKENVGINENEVEESVRLTPRGKNKLNEIELHENQAQKDQTIDVMVPDQKRNNVEIKVEEQKDDL